MLTGLLLIFRGRCSGQVCDERRNQNRYLYDLFTYLDIGDNLNWERERRMRLTASIALATIVLAGCTVPSVDQTAPRFEITKYEMSVIKIFGTSEGIN